MKNGKLKMNKLMIFIMAALALIPYGDTFLGLAIICIFLSIGTGLFQPTVLSLISEVTPEDEQVVTLGVNQSVSAIARVLGPLWGGFAFEYLGYPFPFLTGAAFTFIIFIATVFYCNYSHLYADLRELSIGLVGAPWVRRCRTAY